MCTPWITGDDLAAARSDVAALVGRNTDVLDTAATAASESLFALSGRKFPGICGVTLRPTARPPSWTVRDWSMYLSNLTGYGYSASWGYCYGDGHARCDVDTRRAIDLGVYPLVAVDAVRIDGVVLANDPAGSAYTIGDDRYLVRTDGGAWPTCQSWTLPDTEPGTFAVDVRFGSPPPAAGVLAAIALAAEFAKSGVGQESALPSSVTRVSRQGVDWSFFDPVQLFKNRLTGVPLADQFILATNPHRQTSRSRVLSPDTIRSHRTSPIRTGGTP